MIWPFNRGGGGGPRPRITDDTARYADGVLACPRCAEPWGGNASINVDHLPYGMRREFSCGRCGLVHEIADGVVITEEPTEVEFDA